VIPSAGAVKLGAATIKWPRRFSLAEEARSGNEAGGISMGKNKKAPAKSLKEKRAAKQAKEASKPSAKAVSKTARASGAKG
jgi:hypothetical protein